MELIPAIDIRGGKCVRLYMGNFAEETIYAEDPVQVARHWRSLGAKMLHVVDLDGAREGVPVNSALIRGICAEVDVPVQVGGGIRSLSSIEATLSAGAERVALGTLALEHPNVLTEALARWGDRIAVSLDERDGILLAHGWREATIRPSREVAAALSAQGVAWLIYTDISRDGTLHGPNFVSLSDIQQAAGVKTRVIASGGVGSPDDLFRLQEMGVWGAIVGKALYTGDVNLAKSLEALAGSQSAKGGGFDAQSAG